MVLKTKQKIIFCSTLCLIIPFFVFCSSKEWRYIYSKDKQYALTIVQYLKYGDTSSNAYYIYYGKISKSFSLPKSNYLKLGPGTKPLWIKFSRDGHVHILYGMGELLENNLIDDKIKISRFLRKKEFEQLTNGDPDQFQKIYFHDL